MSEANAFSRSPAFSDSTLSSCKRVMSHSCTCNRKASIPSNVLQLCNRTYDEIDIFSLKEVKLGPSLVCAETLQEVCQENLLDEMPLPSCFLNMHTHRCTSSSQFTESLL